MPKRSSKKTSTSYDPQVLARKVLDRIDPEADPHEKNPAAVALGRLGGLKGGKARAQKLTKRKLSEIAKKAAKSRWDKNR